MGTEGNIMASAAGSGDERWGCDGVGGQVWQNDAAKRRRDEPVAREQTPDTTVGVCMGGTHAMVGRKSYGHRPSHPCNTGTEHVRLPPTRQILIAPSAKRREVFGESHGG